MNFWQSTKGKKTLLLLALSMIAAIIRLKYNPAGTAWSLMPPAIAIFIAFVSGHILISLGLAVFFGGFIAAYGGGASALSSVIQGFTYSGNYFFKAGIDPVNLQILGFVFFILSMVHVMTLSGGLYAVVDRMKRFIKGPRSAQFMTSLLGCFIFFDDYANTMIVGSTMRKVTDKFKISRAKLAFLVDATSAPIVGVALVSTWVGYEVGLFSDVAKKLEWGRDGYAIFLDSLGFQFYCFFMLIFVFTNVITGVDYGPMKTARPEVYVEPEKQKEKHSLSCALIPLSSLLVLIFILLWRDGGGISKGYSVFNPSHWRDVLSSGENGTFILFVSSVCAWTLANLSALLFAKTRFSQLSQAFINGLKSWFLPASILIVAWSLKSVCDDLNTGEYIVSLLGASVSPMWLPAAIFIISAITAFATGTSWGAMAILIPTVSPLAMTVAGGEYNMFVPLCLAAILDGSIMGDHCSPVSDTTIMSSISTECDLLEHVKTQMPYSLSVGTIALLVGYIPMGLGWSHSGSFAVAIGIIIGFFMVLKLWRKPQKAAI